MGADMDDHHDILAGKAAASSGQNGPGDRAKQQEAERKERAAKKLRENLARRKQQARARRAGEADETVGLPAAKTDESC